MQFKSEGVPQLSSNSPRARAQATRLAAIALILYGRGKATGEELADKLNVTLRTIYRDVARLQEIGFPLVSVPGPSGGFAFGVGEGSSNGMIMTERDLMDLFTQTGLLVADKATIEAVVGLVSDTIDNTDRRTLMRISERILFDPEEWYTHDRPSPDLTTIRQALLQDHQLQISFTERTGPKVFEDTFEPLGMVWKGGFWYLYGHSHRESRNRRIRIQRIVHVHDTGKSFIRPAGFDLLKHWRSDLEDFGKGETRVVIRIEQPAIAEFENFNWKRENKIIKEKDHWLVEMNVDRFDWLVPLVLSYAGDVIVIAPEGLRSKIALAADTVLATHSGSTQKRKLDITHYDDTRSRAAKHRRISKK